MFEDRNSYKYGLTVSLGTDVQNNTLFEHFLEKNRFLLEHNKKCAVKTDSIDSFLGFLQDNIDTLNQIIEKRIEKTFTLNTYGNAYFAALSGFRGEKEYLLKGPIYFDCFRTNNCTEHPFINKAYSDFASLANINGTAVHFVKDQNLVSCGIPVYNSETKTIILEKEVMQK